ncbi:LacI family DNA-binding transcriptional regulator [Lacisediminihabitans profunda]|uniref:LacI family DNA-binding transcriptional regulator n=1 Tax=Lacisediminihabitans profunda TaxID=2594790 RepID=A0A5C8UXN0_9MICO|nr:LacI family DNA-binding transcriptional regulator [Lacisediminihabitans profunda]TXN32442.1 LacI family DNA-binding transcriptional regulator [Lacisediminihabitans profunda]
MANITDVARLAGVSHQTVSRVLNNENTVRPSTKARVEAAIAELHYRPSMVARALVTRKTRTIGLISTGNPLYGPSSTALGFNEAAREAGYQVTSASMSTSDRGAILEAIDVLVAQNVEALVLIASDVASIEAVQDLELQVPLITAESSGRMGGHSVSIDQFRGAELATSYLADLGHRRIVHLAGPSTSLDAAERERGWRSVLASRGLETREPVAGDWSPESGYAAAERLLGGGDFTAIFAANDQMALGVLHALSDRGLPVPGRISIVGFDDIPEAAHFIPPLTTVRQDFGELGRRIMESLLEVLRGQEFGEPVRTEPRLIERASAAPVGAGRAVTQPIAPPT